MTRPEPAAPPYTDLDRPVSYPDPPTDIGTERYLTEFVSSFEKLYRRNRLIHAHGSDLETFGFSPRETWMVDGSSEVGIAGVQYTYWHEVDDGDSIIHADSGNQVAVYYVDESVALRAHERGRRESGVEPDPLETGEEVACFE